MKIFLILPTQLFKNIKLLKDYNKIILIEDPYYINNKYHKQKLVVYIAGLNYYYDYLCKKLKDIDIEYISFNNIKKIYKLSDDVHMYNPIDYPLINKYKVIYHDSPLFLETNKNLEEYKSTIKNTIYSHAEFYKWQRKKLDILMDGDKPLYGKWSFDTENRKKFDKEYEELKIKTYNNKYIKEAKNYISKYFPSNFGSIESIYYPITHTSAESHFNIFLIKKLNSFGPTQDAISKDVIYGEHSNISVLLNIGLLSPEYVINKVLDYFYASNIKKKIISSVEGFIRQIFWREYVRFIYYFHRDDLINSNYFEFTKKMPNSWYNATTDLSILNTMIKKVYKYAYLHHIERLMVVGNLALLNEIHPKEVYNWFMTCFIDSTGEWVMLGNSSLMSQHCNNKIKMMKRIYICSDNYIKKMSDYKKDNGLDEIHDLYLNFLKKYKNKLKHDYVLASQLNKY